MISNSTSIQLADPGRLDPTFANNGICHIPVDWGSVRSIVADGSGAYFLVVWKPKQFWLYRISPDGILDLEFGQNGVSRWSFVAGVDSLPTQLLVQPNGKILVAGLSGDDPSARHSAIARMNEDGSPDLIFGSRVFSCPDLAIPSVCLQVDGRILFLASRLDLSNGESEVVLRRLLPNGELDINFGDEGCIVVRLNDQKIQDASLAVTGDGKFLICGTISQGTDLALVIGRFESDGVPDQSFGAAGCWQSNPGFSLGEMVVDDQAIICACTAMDRVRGFAAGVHRVTRDGVTDLTFNEGKAVVVDIPNDVPGFFVQCAAVAVQSDKSIVFGGDAGRDSRAFMGRLLAHGAVDRGFGEGGLFIPGHETSLHDLKVQSGQPRVLAAIDAGGVPRSPKIMAVQL